MMIEPGATGGVPVAPGGAPGAMVTRAGQVQYGDVLLGVDTTAGWRELIGWRDTPAAQTSDAPRPQAHGSYAGDVLGDALTVTFDYLVRGRPDDKARAVDTLEQYLPLDGIERALVVDDGTGPWLRMARVIGRQVPQDYHYRHGPLECSVQFLCSDPRRYALDERMGTVTLPASSGGLEYPLSYPLAYGTSSSGSLTASNAGSVPTPLVATFHGPLSDPILTASTWRLGFNITLADGERLVVDTSEGTALLNGTADRLYTIRNDSDPVERCLLPPGPTNLALTATTGTGRLVAQYRDARM